MGLIKLSFKGFKDFFLYLYKQGEKSVMKATYNETGIAGYIAHAGELLAWIARNQFRLSTQLLH